jgi:hypothetical protein
LGRRNSAREESILEVFSVWRNQRGSGASDTLTSTALLAFSGQLSVVSCQLLEANRRFLLTIEHRGLTAAESSSIMILLLITEN